MEAVDQVGGLGPGGPLRTNRCKGGPGGSGGGVGKRFNSPRTSWWISYTSLVTARRLQELVFVEMQVGAGWIKFQFWTSDPAGGNTGGGGGGGAGGARFCWNQMVNWTRCSCATGAGGAGKDVSPVWDQVYLTVDFMLVVELVEQFKVELEEIQEQDGGGRGGSKSWSP